MIVDEAMEQVTPWRQQLAQTMATIITAVEQTAPELRYAAARRCAEDLRYAIACGSRKEYGRVFDPLVDGPN